MKAALMLLMVAGYAFGTVVDVPEINTALVPQALTVLGGALLLLGSRRKA